MGSAALDIDFEDDELYDEDGNYVVSLTQPQSDFWFATEKYPLFCGGFGSGKTTTMTCKAMEDLMLYPGSRIGIYAPTFDLLSLNNIPFFEEYLSISDIPYKKNEQKHTINVEVEDQFGKIHTGTLIFRSLEKPARIVGYQVFRSHVDEIDTLPPKKAKEAWNKIIARNRQKIYIRSPKGRILKNPKTKKRLAHLNKVSAYTTPEGFGFVHNQWVEQVSKDAKKARLYGIYKVSTESNLANLPDDYIETLETTYDAQLVKAYIKGEFVNLVGENVYRGFSRTANDSIQIADEKDILEIGMDFNVVHGACVIHVTRNGCPHAVDEIHDAYDTDEQIAAIKERYPRNQIINIYPDASGDHRTSANTTESDIAKLNNAGFSVYNDPSNPAIKDRVNSYNAMIKNSKDERRYYVNTRKCPMLVKSLEQQIWGSNGLPDKKEGLDHIVDGAGYYINYRYGITRPIVSSGGLPS